MRCSQAAYGKCRQAVWSISYLLALCSDRRDFCLQLLDFWDWRVVGKGIPILEMTPKVDPKNAFKIWSWGALFLELLTWCASSFRPNGYQHTQQKRETRNPNPLGVKRSSLVNKSCKTSSCQGASPRGRTAAETTL